MMMMMEIYSINHYETKEKNKNKKIKNQKFSEKLPYRLIMVLIDQYLYCLNKLLIVLLENYTNILVLHLLLLVIPTI
jgi:hypothetical protein